MNRLASCLAVLLALSAPVPAQEACVQDDAELSNELDQNIVIDNARTAEDFVNSLAYHFFTSIPGHYDFVHLTTDLSVSEFARYFTALASQFDYDFVVCNEIGQCGQGRVLSTYSKMPSEGATRAVNSVLDFLSGGELSIGTVFGTGLVGHEINVTLADGSAASTVIREGYPHLLTSGILVLSVRSADDPLAADDRCRNNEGELTNVESAAGSGSDATGDELLNEGYWMRVQVDWYCYPDETGVVCRAIYDYIWIDILIA